MTRHLRIPLILAGLTLVVHAHGQWTQALQSAAPTPEGGNVTRLCPDGGLVTLGRYRDQATFGTITLPGGFPAQEVVFVVKHDAAGQVEWAHAITNTDADDRVAGQGLAVDGEGDIIVGGTNIDTLLVDGAYATHVQNQQGTEAMFIIKFAPAGDVLWAVDAESPAFGSALMALAVDPADNIWFGGPISAAASKVFKLDGSTGIEMVESAVIPGQVRQIGTNAAGNVYLRGQSTSSFTINGVACPANNALGGNTTNWTGMLSTNGVAQWFHVPDQGHTGYSPWQHVNQAVAQDGHCFVEAYGTMRINGDTIASGADRRGLYLLDASGTPIWWMRLNRSGSLQVEDMATDPAGDLWITGTCAGTLDLLDTVVTHTGFFAFHVSADGHVRQRVFGPTVLHTWSVDAAPGLAVFGGAYSGAISFGPHALTDNQEGLFVARYQYPVNVGMPDAPAAPSLVAFPNPAQHAVRISGVPDGTFTLAVHNGLGQELRRWERFRAHTDAVDLRGLPTGPLFLRLYIGATTRTVRIVHVD